MSDSNRDEQRTDSSPDAGNDRAAKTGVNVDSGTGVGDRDDRGRDHRDESTQVANEERRRNTSVVSLIVAAIGAWVVLSVLVVYDVAQATLWNNVLVGAVVFLAAGYNYYRVTNDTPLSLGISGLVALCGLWLIISPALLAMTGPFWSTLASGVLIAGLAGYNAYDAREARSVATEPEAESS